MTETTVLRQMLPNNLQTYADSVFLMTKTVNPHTFFERFNAAMQISENIAAAYCAYELYDDVDEWCERRENLVAEKDSMLIDMLNRMYELKRPDLIETVLTDYYCELSPQVEEHIEYLLSES